MSLRLFALVVGLCAVALGHSAAAMAPLSASDTTQLRCLALNIYWEARSEPTRGQLAVAHLTLNRVAAPDFPGTVCDVVNEGVDRGRHRCQFSWNCDGAADVPKEPKAWNVALRLAKDAVDRRTQDPTNGALFFHLSTVNPTWAKKMRLTRKIGNHFFYK